MKFIKKEKYQIVEKDLDCKVNLDETAITLNMLPKNIIQNKGDKTVMMKTIGQEKELVSIILAISALGSKLTLLLIFKGKKEAELKKIKTITKC